MLQNAIYICTSRYGKTSTLPVKKCWWQQNSWVVSCDLYILWIFFRSGITVPTAIVVGYVWQTLGKGGWCVFLDPLSSHPWTATRRPILNRVNFICSSLIHLGSYFLPNLFWITIVIHAKTKFFQMIWIWYQIHS